jgi:molecular chaperone DnaK
MKMATTQGISVPAKLNLTREEIPGNHCRLLDRTEMLLESVFAKPTCHGIKLTTCSCCGSSRMPMVSEMLHAFPAKAAAARPDECVAKARPCKRRCSKKPKACRRFVGHVLSHSLGVAVMRNGQAIVDHVVPSLTRLPVTQAREGYTTTVENQTTVQIRVYEGESTDLQSYGKGPIGVFDLDTSPPRPKGQPKISVQFHCDENGRITAVARDRDTGQESRTVIALQSSRTGEESTEEAQLLADANVS